jgi:geranylgeranyl reductase family protein
VIGAGPAGTVTAHRLARQGVSVALLDRARFPRDKPCGGGLTIRAVRLLPFSIRPVVEDIVDTIELGLGYRRRFERRRSRPLVLMTQRHRLDAFLAEQAADAGAEFRDGVRATGISASPRGITVATERGGLRADVAIGADGANGITARSFGLCRRPAYGVALEGNLPAGDESHRGRIVFELGVLRGGYGWIFPKAGHLNVGVGGWDGEAARLRNELRRLCRERGLDFARLRDVRGHRLPVKHRDAELARQRVLVTGDAAGLVDPLSGDGIYGALVSARLAADAILDFLAGRSVGLEPYGVALRRELAAEFRASWAAKHLLDRFPLLMFTLARAERVQRALERLARGEVTESGTKWLARAGRVTVPRLRSDGRRRRRAA